MEWDRARSDDGGGVGGVVLDWVFTVEGSARVRMCRDGQGVMRGGRNESGWVGIGESLTVGFPHRWMSESVPGQSPAIGGPG